MKITAPQIRVLRNMLHEKAKAACRLQAELYDQNQKKNMAAVKQAASRVIKKYEKKLYNGLYANLGSGWEGEYCLYNIEVSLNADVREECVAEIKKAIKEVTVVGSRSTSNVAIASLDMTQECYRGESRGMLEVPTKDLEAWRTLAADIDGAFLTGEVNKLVWLIDNIKV